MRIWQRGEIAQERGIIVARNARTAGHREIGERVGGEGRDAEKRENPRLIKAARQSVSLQRSPAIISGLPSLTDSKRERGRVPERQRAPSHAIIEPALLAARLAPPAPHLRHQPGRRSDNPTGEAAPTIYGYSDDTSGGEARGERRVKAEAL